MKTENRKNPCPNNLNPRQPYEKPNLRVIDLVAEEVMSVGCKLSNGGFAPESVVACTQLACSQEGS